MLFWTSNLDVVFLVYGLAFVLLGIIVRSVKRVRSTELAWTPLILFGFLHGFNEWVDMTLLSRPGNVVLARTGLVLLATSFLCLMEFGRRNATRAAGSRLSLWVYTPAVLAVAAGWYIDAYAGAAAMLRMTLALPGALLSAVAFWRWGRVAGGRSPVLRSSLVLVVALYGVAAGVVSSPTELWPASLLSSERFLHWAGVPIQLVRGLLACLISVLLWREYSVWRLLAFSHPALNRTLRVERVGIVLIAFLLLAGSWLTSDAGSRYRANQIERLMATARPIAMSLSAAELRELEEQGASGRRLGEVSSWFQKLADITPGIRYIYLMEKTDEGVVFLLDTEPAGLRGAGAVPLAAFREVYRDAPPEVFESLSSGLPVGSRPYKDKWGKFVSVFYPVPDAPPDRPVLLGVDMDAGGLLVELMSQRLTVLVITGLLVLLVVSGVSLWRKNIETSELASISMQRTQQQELLFELAVEVASSEGDSAIPLDDIVARAGEVLQVEGVGVWAYDSAQDQLLPMALRQEMTQLKSYGMPLGAELTHELLELLSSARAIAIEDRSKGTWPGRVIDWLNGLGVRSVLLASYRVGDEIAGMVAFFQVNRAREWLNDEIRLAAEVCGLASQMRANIRRRQAELALRRLNDELEGKVRERTAELSAKHDELQREMAERSRVETERRTLELQMQQAQKFESLGVMAGGVAHDFNNILMAIQGNVELAREEAPADSRTQQYLQDVERASGRAAALARQMLDFAGRGHAVMQGVDLTLQISDMLQILEVSVGKKNSVVCEFETPLPAVDGDPSQISQVILNLVVNASEAMGERHGAITIRTGVKRCEAPLSTTRWLKEELPAGRYVFFEVADNGCGMDEATEQRMFDPFFTTKFTGRGLGLSTVMGIVRGHRGMIEVSSRLGFGTTIRVLFPEGHLVPEKRARMDKPVAVRKGTGAILVVDDEELVLTLGQRMLSRLGYKVLTAASGSVALDLFRQRHSEIEAVLLDLTMPEMDGHEVAERLREIKPGVRIIICSGFNKEDVVARFGTLKLSGFLQKPYTLDMLSSCLRSALS